MDISWITDWMYPPDSDLSDKFHGKVILITGASSGIGRAIAQTIYPFGSQLILASRNVENLETVKKELIGSVSQKLPEPIIFQLDLEAVDKVEGIADRILERVGTVDILINNGGMSVRASALDTQLSVHQRILNVNYLGTVELSRAIVKKMVIKGSGCLVQVSSMQGRLAMPYRATYSASKHALQAWSDSLRAELGGSGVSVMVVSPGYVNTNLSRNAVTADGSSYGKLDPTTAEGYSPEHVAQEVVRAVSRGREEVVVAPLLHKLAIIIRTLAPALFFGLMAQRAKKDR